MFIEKRKQGKNIKYYLSHTFRDDGKTKKIRRYLGQNLTPNQLSELEKKAEKIILEQIEELKTEIFNFSLSPQEINQLNKFDKKIKVFHLDHKDWKKFEEDFVYNTNAIEGSQVLEEEVKKLLEHKKSPQSLDEKETIGLAKAIEYVKNTNEDFSKELILKLHELCFKETKYFAGKFRDVRVVIKDAFGKVVHEGIPVEELDLELDKLIDWYKTSKSLFKPLVLSAIIHNQFEHIHPLRDGNGRVGRLLLNFILIKNNYPPINILLEDRREYYETLKSYSDNGDLKPTLEFLVKQYKKMFKNR